MTKFTAMIPARLGSKRVVKKNIRFLCGKPMMRYAIDAAKASGCFTDIWVNSESGLIGELALASGVAFHRRPDDLALDEATNQDFTYEFLLAHPCDYVVMVNPTSPLLTSDTIRRFCGYVGDGKFDTVLSVLEERAECFFSGNPVNFTTRKKTNSQDLEPVEKVVWALTAWRREHFLAVAKSGGCSVFSGRLGRFAIPLKEACDIDTHEEWDLAESLLLRKAESEYKASEMHFSLKYWEPCDED